MVPQVDIIWVFLWRIGRRGAGADDQCCVGLRRTLQAILASFSCNVV